jgi:hypothetical protein
MARIEGKPKKTAAACSRANCSGCEIEGRLLCVHTRSDLIDFGVLFIGWLIPFLAGMIIGRFWVALSVWIGLAVIFFGYIEALILCRHCPHYAEEGSTLSCHANWGLPKIPKIDPTPMSRAEGWIWIVYVLVLFLYYIPFFIVSSQWLLLGITTWTGFAWAWTVLRTQCVRCYNLSCPVNRVPDEVREVFFKNYPDYAASWSKVKKEGGR